MSHIIMEPFTHSCYVSYRMGHMGNMGHVADNQIYGGRR